MIKLYEEQTKTLYRIQKETGLGIRTLYRYAQNKNKIETMPINVLNKIAMSVNEEPSVLYQKMEDYLKGTK